ncbi:hypothetical protein HYPSUDRAFT_522266 [Hypholoma sublateritium FD-334 SS-4]|uniref:Uncharacterized protein n=1 Tax=Hypholoma sublateritium (strain FD-334 SS-4) TaxID=945553 RepID=A0A0D2PMD6_HYPSF|nr:hypothetical protein HYPSUDRAFT_522266 [Hypholoma sublateritium FD-334 SS-4]
MSAPPHAPAPAPVGTLLHVLRTANRRYAELAAAVRSAQRPTHHARKRAAALKLRVSIAAARALDPRQISTLPLPVLERERTASPAPAVHTRSRGPAIPPPRVTVVAPEAVVAPVPRRALRAAAQLATPPPRVARPGLRSAVPPQVVVLNAADNNDDDAPPRSHWSSSSSSGGEDEDGEETDADAPRLDVPIDASRLSWNSAASFSAGSRASSAGPATPANGAPLTIRIKRKPSASFLDMEDDHVSFEKRPKYERKNWTQHAPRRSARQTGAVSASPPRH